MKIDLSNLPEKHYPGQFFMDFNKDSEYFKICLYHDGSFNFLSKTFDDIHEVLNINPFTEGGDLSSTIENARIHHKYTDTVIVISSGMMIEPKILYRWNQDHWERIKDVRTSIS